MIDPQDLDTPAPPAVTPDEAQPKPRDGRALSAYRHGLTSQIVLLTQEEQRAYAAHCDGYIESLKPEDYVQRHLVKLIANDRWLEESGGKLASAIAVLEIQPEARSTGNPEIDAVLSQGRAWLERGNSLALLSLYQNRIQRRIEKNMAELRKLQAEARTRKAAADARFQQALEDARVLCEQAEARKKPLEDVIVAVFDQFDFSEDEVLARFFHYRDLWSAHGRYGDRENLRKRAA